MILIGENIHIISKTICKSLRKRDTAAVTALVTEQKNMDYIDLNIGPAKGDLADIFPWLAEIVENNSDLGISFDTTNAEAMSLGLSIVKNPKKSFINSTSKDEPRLDKMTDLAAEYVCNLIALTLSKETGIPKTADGRMEIAFEIYEKCLEKGIESENIFFDPLTLPVCVDQAQAIEALNTIKMVKESFDPPVKTVVGLSNISNGSPKEMRPLINRVFGALAYGAGLDAAIVDASDLELVRMFKMLQCGAVQTRIDKIYLELAKSMENFTAIDEIEFDRTCIEEQNIIKAARIIMNENIYSHSFTQV